jgi:hypothetical protein
MTTVFDKVIEAETKGLRKLLETIEKDCENLIQGLNAKNVPATIVGFRIPYPRNFSPKNMDLIARVLSIYYGRRVTPEKEYNKDEALSMDVDYVLHFEEKA